ncbi:MAG: zinc ribbon domain-containing protein [Clostridiales bacterium]|jgi:membrane protease subunit (stomatin/prohibitin family)|nr:zinc ribbon domain-containing protein [Clostridiales bacterium]
MALFDKLGRKITTTTQSMVRGTKDFTDIARLNSLITDEEQQIGGLLMQIGKLYYEAGEYDSNTLIGQMCISLVALHERIAKYQAEIREIKGSKKCPSCGGDVSIAATFCGNCGAKLLVAPVAAAEPVSKPKKFCTTCGEELMDDATFCISCGQKVE